MNITGTRIMILGGPGLVGMAVARRLLVHNPKELILTALTRREVDEALVELKNEAGETKLSGRWGNIFVRSEFKDLPRKDLLGDPVRRDRFILDTLEPLSDEICRASFLNEMIRESKPQVVIDCVNTATGLAYQDVFEESRQTYALLKNWNEADEKARGDFQARVETLLGTQYTPQLIRHIQILWASLTENQVHTYLKVGTTGTGGMGLNIPYTHSEDKPSRVLLAKSAMAGAHTLLLFLLGRTAREHSTKLGWSPDRNIKPEAPVIKEVKPAAAIAWKGITYGEVRQKGKPVEIFDLDPSQAYGMKDVLSPAKPAWKRQGSEVLKAPYIDTGENGIFSRGEFEAITDEGQMEFITPEEIADVVAAEIMGGNSGGDMISAFDSAILGPTYRAGFLRQRAIEGLRQLEQESGVPSVAFENLGPPRLSKLLFELHLLMKERGLLKDNELGASELSKRCENRILEDAKLRSQILSLGLAIVLRDGRVLRGPNMIIPTRWEMPADGQMTMDHLNRYSHQGWVDLREPNLQIWVDRLKTLHDETMRPENNRNTGSGYVRNRTYWETVENQGSLGSVISWIFLREDGERVKR
ncbi:MAG: hypothetical protein A2X94_07320 [Bdellovibrionales bacterium GWB1_55_8]|nr:MAG: hypothetical protein A2X94_07320 [Bdellovibrionales bacterium GWB1_55_8]